MSLQSPRTSVFTFQSAVHSSHVLRSLNEQRQRDVLCDVTVVVEGSSFRAHGAVLASCSDYFHSRITKHSRRGLVITLPEEVTVEGFEPLLEFAYTSKLLFTKENIQAVYTSAALLGFYNLETACFDFLIPKFSDGLRSSPAGRRRACCKARTAGVSPGNDAHRDQPQYRPTGQKTGSDISLCSPTIHAAENLRGSQNTVPSLRGNMQTDFPLQCPLNPQAAVSSGQEQFCFQNCGSELPPLSLCLGSPSGVCPVVAVPYTDDPKAGAAANFCDADMLEIGRVGDQSEGGLVDCPLTCDLPIPSSPENIAAGLEEGTGGELDQSHESFGNQSQPGACGPCPLNMPGMEERGELLEQRGAGLDGTGSVDLPDPALSRVSPEERSSVEREVAEHLARGFWPDLCPPHTDPLPLEPMDHSSLGKAADFHWLKQLDLSSSTGDCPFLRDLGAGEAEADPSAPETDSLSQSEKIPYVSSVNSETPPPGADTQSQSEKSPYVSSVNSAEESDLDTDGDTETNNRRAQEVQLPFPVQQISSLSRSAFQQLLRRQHLTPDQLELVHDVRRRSKNRVAAQRCRKRKLDSIHVLEVEINTLRGEKEKLILEHVQLKQSMEQTLQSLSGLCHSVCSEAGPEPDQLLAKLSSPDFPISALLTPLASPGLSPGLSPLLREGGPAAMDSCPLEGTPTGVTTAACPETEEGAATDGSKSGSNMDVCLGLNGSV